MSTDDGHHPSSALNERIDALVLKLDALITAVGIQDKLRRRLSKIGMAIVVAMALVVVGVVLNQNRESRQRSCETQNDTRGVVRDLLQSAKDAGERQAPPDGLKPEELPAFQQRVAQANAFYADQIAKIKPLDC